MVSGRRGGLEGLLQRGRHGVRRDPRGVLGQVAVGVDRDADGGVRSIFDTIAMGTPAASISDAAALLPGDSQALDLIHDDDLADERLRVVASVIRGWPRRTSGSTRPRCSATPAEPAS